MRINKYLAACGVASRRECDRLIADGAVTINGQIAQVGADVGAEDTVEVNGKAVAVQKNEYYILNKPKGYICSVKDEKGRKTVLDLMPQNAGRIYPVCHVPEALEVCAFFSRGGDDPVPAGGDEVEVFFQPSG